MIGHHKCYEWAGSHSVGLTVVLRTAVSRIAPASPVPNYTGTKEERASNRSGLIKPRRDGWRAGYVGGLLTFSRERKSLRLVIPM